MGNHEMAFVMLSDLTGNIELVIFPKIYQQVKTYLVADSVVLVKGRLDEKDNRLTVIVEDIFTPTPKPAELDRLVRVKLT